MKNKGFSLVELIVVIAIMAILVGVAVPVYTSYIEKANKSKDIQMVDEVAHALQIYSAANPGNSGWVVLTLDGAIGDEGFGEDAIKATFGDEWDEELVLSWDGWVADYSGGVGSAANNIAASKLTESLSVLTNLADVVIGSNGASSATTIISALFPPEMATEITSELSQYEGDDKYSTIASNLLVKYVAEELSGVTVSSDGEGNVETSETSQLGGLALTYAMLYSMAESDSEYRDAAAEKLAAFNLALAEIADREQADSSTPVMSQIYTALGELMASEDLTDSEGNTITFGEAYEQYFADQGETDLSGIISAMGVVESLSGEYNDKESLANSNLFQSAEVLGLLEAYQVAAENKGVVVHIDVNGKVTVLPSELMPNG